MQIIRVGIIGQGRSGHDIHAHYLMTPAGQEKFKIVMVADLLKDRCQRAEQEMGCVTSTDYHDLFQRDDLDLIINSTPSHLHVPVTRDILKAGFNVLCEKPLARRVKDVDELIALRKKMKRLLAVYQQSRFNPYFTKILEVIDSGVLGRVVMAKVAVNGFGRRWDWQTLQSMNGGNLLNTGPHPVGQALMLFDRKGAMPKVWCKMDRANTFGDAEDHVKLLLWAKGKPTVDVEISSCCAYPTHLFQVFGTRGGLTCSGNKVQWRYFDEAKAPKQKLIRTPLPGPSYCNEKLPWQQEEWEKPLTGGEQFDYMAHLYYGNLYEALTQGTPLEVTLPQVRTSVAVMEESHRQNPLSKLKK
jgi:scyllo-inositol 2-dehydrogenase (NADP+)